MDRNPGGISMTSPTAPGTEGILPEKLSERLNNLHKVVQAVLSGNLTKNISLHPTHDSFAVLERDMYNMVNKIQEMGKQNELAILKIKEALGEIISLTNTVKEATESIKAGKMEIPFDTESSISEIRELKKRFQYMISVIRLLVTESSL
jgi:methyl-accepting chemotaxis protein